MIEKLVIDTNVAVIANGKDGRGEKTHASELCQLICIELLAKCKELHIALDEIGLIMEEYARHLSYAGKPGVGDIFFKYLHDHQYSSKNIYRVSITISDDNRRGFEELPINQLDPSDRKMLATAIVSNAKIINA